MKGAAYCGCALSTLVAEAGTVKHIHKQDVHAGDRLYILTANSTYHVRMAEGGWCEVSGGWFDRTGVAPFKTRIAGCTWGGSMLMVDVVAACGLCVEFGNRVVTSPVRTLILLPGGSEN